MIKWRLENQGSFLSGISFLSVTALRPTKLPIQMVPEALSPGAKVAVVEILPLTSIWCRSLRLHP